MAMNLENSFKSERPSHGTVPMGVSMNKVNECEDMVRQSHSIRSGISQNACIPHLW